MITFRITSDTITPHARRVLADLQPGGALSIVVGRAVANELRKFYRELNAKRANKLGGKRSNFYSRVAETVQNPTTGPGSVRVAISHPHIAQRLYGGTIKPTKAKALAVPADARSYGVYARIYPGDLAFIPGRGKAIGYLVEGEEKTITRGPRKGGKRIVPKPAGALLYVLKGAVTQRADETVLPTGSRMSRAITQAARLVRPGSK